MMLSIIDGTLFDFEGRIPQTKLQLIHLLFAFTSKVIYTQEKLHNPNCKNNPRVNSYNFIKYCHPKSDYVRSLIIAFLERTLKKLLKAL